MALSDAELLNAIANAESTAIGSVRGEISSDRSDAIDRFLGKPYGDEKEGRSSVVSRDVADVVEGVLSNVLKPFVSGDQLVEFTPQGPEDEAAAQQETDYVNFIMMERNNGFLVLRSSVWDALLLRNGYAKAYWKVRDDIVIESYRGQSQEQVAMLLQDPEIEVAEHSEYPDPDSPLGMPPQMVYDVKVRRKRPTEYVEILPVPPEEIIVSERTTGPSLQETDFVQHRVTMSLSDIRAMGYDVPDDISDSESGEELEDRARERFGSGGELDEDPTSDPARRLVLFKETWIRIDRDEDGTAELRKVCQVGQNLLADEEADIIPMACFTGMLMPHQHLGVSIYDLVQDLARLKTALLRAFMDNKYLSNNGRHVIDVDRVNVDDMLNSRPGGVVRVQGDPGSAVFPLQTVDTGPSALSGLEYLDTVRENRTGYTRYAQGMDSESLVNKTATGLMQATSQSQLRLEMISRTIAETGMRDLARIVHAMTLKYSSRAEKIRLKGKWVEVNPREWVRRTDLAISVGLGSGTSDQQYAKLMGLAPLLQQGQAAGLVGQQEIYNYGVEVLKAAGYKVPDKFMHPPEIGPDGKPVTPPPKKDPLVEAEEVKGKVAMQKHQSPDATEIAKAKIAAQTDEKKAKLDADVQLRIATSKGAIEGAKVGLDVQQQSHDQEMDKAQLQLDHMQMLEQLVGRIGEAIGGFREAVDAMNAPKEIVRDKSGRASGVRRAAH